VEWEEGRSRGTTAGRLGRRGTRSLPGCTVVEGGRGTVGRMVAGGTGGEDMA
jgi:hypothetical protein